MTEQKTASIFIRIAPSDLAKLREAAKVDRRTVSDFVRVSAVGAAERMVTADAQRQAS